MKIKNYLLSLSLAMIFPLSACGQGSQLTTNVTVLSEDGLPIEGAHVHIGYPSHQPSSIRGEHRKGYSNEEGKFSFTGTASWKASIAVTKDGYYETMISPKITEPDAQGNARVKREIDVTLILREIRDPVPMYAGRIKTPFPSGKGTFGFDLLKRDWVAPEGQGSVVDVWVTIDFDYNHENDYEISMRWEFTGENNGIQPFTPPVRESQFKSPYEAPETGYLPDITWKRSRRPNPNRKTGEPSVLIKSDLEISTASLYPANFYFIRFRSSVDKNGKVEGGYYGKVYSSGSFYVGLEADKTGEMFTGVIYVNPEMGARNVEPDLERNLSKNLPWGLSPRFP